MNPTVLEICAGAGGQAVGLEAAGFKAVSVIEIDVDACRTLRANRPKWDVIEADVRSISGKDFRGIDLLAGGVPCPPFSIAGKQLGSEDERDLFPEALRLLEEAQPAAVMLENVPGFASARFDSYREKLLRKIRRLGYEPRWDVLNASCFGVPQLRPRFILVALRPKYAERFHWPKETPVPPTVADAISDLMGANHWPGLSEWSKKASRIAPTVVGGSKRHGGPDLGPTRARKQWAQLGVDGLGIANDAPGVDFPFDKHPRLTVRMVARIQGFPDSWVITGAKTASYRQIGNAFPPPVAAAVAGAIKAALAGNAPPLTNGEQQTLFEALRQ